VFLHIKWVFYIGNGCFQVVLGIKWVFLGVFTYRNGLNRVLRVK
jgi:hypothetical protein